MKFSHFFDSQNTRNYLWWFVAIVFLTLYNLTPRMDSFDSYYYMLAGENFLNGKIDCLRTPVYPLLLKFCQNLFGDRGMSIAITILQSIVYLLSLYSLKRIADKTIKNENVRFAILFFYVICIAPGWCNEILTESLSISGCVIIADFIISFIEKPTLKHNIIIHLLLLFIVFLRPTFILFFAILPVIWIILFFRKYRCQSSIALLFTVLCMLCIIGYAKMYQKEYHHFGFTTTFAINKVYDSQRGGFWNPDAVTDPDCKKWIDSIDNAQACNYGPIYSIIQNNPKSLPLINKGCDEIINAHKSQYYQHKAELFIFSFDKRFLASVNTRTVLSSILFASSLFLSFPVSLFYLIVFVSAFSLLVYVIKKRQVPLIAFFIIATIMAQCVGIIISAADSYERYYLPVYPLFVILLGLITERIIPYFSKSTNNQPQK